MTIHITGFSTFIINVVFTRNTSVYIQCIQLLSKTSDLTLVCICVHFQIDEIRNIGSLPCLEKVVLSNNPLSIIPDYRTKVLAQFGDRASEVSHVELLFELFSFFPFS